MSVTDHTLSVRFLYTMGVILLRQKDEQPTAVPGGHWRNFFFISSQRIPKSHARQQQLHLLPNMSHHHPVTPPALELIGCFSSVGLWGYWIGLDQSSFT